MNSYKETLEWMYAQLPMYQRKGAAAYRPGLEAMESLAQYLESPQKALKSIHVGGTNGKGSTSHMLASVLQVAGFKTGLYSSPHLLDFRERIKVNGDEIPKNEVVSFITDHKPYFEKNKLSFFEMTVGMALWYFKKVQVDFAVIEVGMGGRLDATNIIHPELAVITNIGLDHTQFLGDTHQKIAREKAGIIKKGIGVIIGEKDERTRGVFESVAQENSAPLFYAEAQFEKYHTDLEGDYQKKNIITAVTALTKLPKIQLDAVTIQSGLANVIKYTKLMGRWQKVGVFPKVVLDVAHNKEGLSSIANQIKEIKFERLHLVMGFVQGREVEELLALFPVNTNFYLSSPSLERALPMEALKEMLQNTPFQITFSESVVGAFSKAQSLAAPDDFILVTGSTFVVAEVLEYLENKNFE